MDGPAKAAAIEAKRGEREPLQARIASSRRARRLPRRRARQAQGPGSADAFDDKVLATVKEQAAAQGIRY